MLMYSKQNKHCDLSYVVEDVAVVIGIKSNIFNELNSVEFSDVKDKL